MLFIETLELVLIKISKWSNDSAFILLRVNHRLNNNIIIIIVKSMELTAFQNLAHKGGVNQYSVRSRNLLPSHLYEVRKNIMHCKVSEKRCSNKSILSILVVSATKACQGDSDVLRVRP